MKNSLIFCLLLFFLSGCVSDKDTYSENDVEVLSTNNEEVIVSQEMNYLDKSAQIATSSVPYTLVKGFIPDEEIKEEMPILNEQFTYLSIDKDSSVISGELVIENIRDHSINIKSLFLQGNNSVNIKPKESDQWSNVLEIDVPAETALRIPIEIKWNTENDQEMSYLFIDQSSDPEFYEGTNISMYRYFVQSKDINIEENQLDQQAFQLSDDEIKNIESFIPSASWYGENGDAVEYIEEDNTLYSATSPEGIKLNSIPYSTAVDIIMIDEFGNTELLAENHKIHKHEETLIPLKDRIEFDIEKKQFIIILNNREENKLADWKAVDINKKPFPTSFEDVIQIYDIK
ncbi:hypothetical protein [Oceanobacillus kimchii]|uniref:hypothetical protein n=1 Tax=Oceanobacillus kimchii TaxID=746691 RepID=UPI003C70A80C